jgi:hypothetical protein
MITSVAPFIAAIAPLSVLISLIAEHTSYKLLIQLNFYRDQPLSFMINSIYGDRRQPHLVSLRRRSPAFTQCPQSWESAANDQGDRARP